VDWIQVSTRTGLVQPIQGIVMCAVWKVWWQKYVWNVFGMMWPYVSIKHDLWFITQDTTVKLLQVQTLCSKLKPGTKM
jgi:hypothetical protein